MMNFLRRQALFYAGFLVALSGSGMAQQGAAPAAGPIEVDVVHLRDGTTMAGQIEAITDEFLNIRTAVSLGGGKQGSAKRQYRPEQVEYIAFAPLAGEDEALANTSAIDVETLAALWKQRRMHVHRPKSTAGKLGLLTAAAYLQSSSEYDHKLALGIYQTLEQSAWSKETKNLAREGRLRALITLRRLDEAMAEARKLAEESEDSRMLIEARYVLAQADFEKLKQLLEENPKWQEDDLVRPDVEALYHSTIDQFLFPYLFHGTEQASAARGLMAAAEIYGLFGKIEHARACAEDVVALYPKTSQATTASKLLGSGQ